MRAKIATVLRSAPVGGSVQQQTDRLMIVVIEVLEAVQALAPKGKPLLYAKRW